jgi:hypothetical protein
MESVIIVGQIIIRNIKGDPTIQNMGSLNKCLDVYSTCYWVKIDGVKYQTVFNKNKTRIILSNIGESDDFKDVSDSAAEHIVHEMNMRIEDINHLENQIQSITRKLYLPSTNKAARRSIVSEIDNMVDLVRNHKNELYKRHSVNYASDISYTRTQTTTRISMKHGVRYRIGNHMVTWMHYIHDIHLDDVEVSTTRSRQTTHVTADIPLGIRNHISNVVQE